MGGKRQNGLNANPDYSAEDKGTEKELEKASGAKACMDGLAGEVNEEAVENKMGWKKGTGAMKESVGDEGLEEAPADVGHGEGKDGLNK